MCSENMQQIYRRTPIPKCDSTVEITLRHGSYPVFYPVFLSYIFRTHSYKNPSGGFLLIRSHLKRCQRFLVLLNMKWFKKLKCSKLQTSAEKCTEAGMLQAKIMLHATFPAYLQRRYLIYVHVQQN